MKMLKSSLIALALVVASCSSLNKKSSSLFEQANNVASKQELIGGIVALYNDQGNFFCSGFVVSDTTVVTAAHCMGSMTENVVGVKSGNSATLGQFVGFNFRTDIATISGDFREFSKFVVETDPAEDAYVNKDSLNLVSCGYPYGGKPVCYRLSNLEKYVDMIGATGQLYAGMSGGPVIDMNTGKVYGVNHAVTIGKVVFAPVVNLFNAIRPIYQGE